MLFRSLSPWRNRGFRHPPFLRCTHPGWYSDDIILPSHRQPTPWGGSCSVLQPSRRSWHVVILIDARTSECWVNEIDRFIPWGTVVLLKRQKIAAMQRSRIFIAVEYYAKRIFVLAPVRPSRRPLCRQRVFTRKREPAVSSG